MTIVIVRESNDNSNDSYSESNNSGSNSGDYKVKERLYNGIVAGSNSNN